MKTIELEAKSKGTVVGTSEIQIPETVQEAVEMLSPAVVLKYIVLQMKIVELNRVRGEATSGTKVHKVIRDKLSAIQDPGVRAMVAEALGISPDALI